MELAIDGTRQLALDGFQVNGGTFTETRLLAGTTTLGTELLGPGHIRALGSGETVLGALGPASSEYPERLVLTLSAAGLPARVADDTLGVIWAKVAFNCVMNTLCAIASIPVPHPTSTTRSPSLKVWNRTSCMRRRSRRPTQFAPSTWSYEFVI